MFAINAELLVAIGSLAGARFDSNPECASEVVLSGIERPALQSTHNWSLRTPVFPDNRLHRYWQPLTTSKSKHTAKTQKKLTAKTQKNTRQIHIHIHSHEPTSTGLSFFITRTSSNCDALQLEAARHLAVLASRSGLQLRGLTWCTSLQIR